MCIFHEGIFMKIESASVLTRKKIGHFSNQIAARTNPWNKSAETGLRDHEPKW